MKYFFLSFVIDGLYFLFFFLLQNLENKTQNFLGFYHKSNFFFFPHNIFFLPTEMDKIMTIFMVILTSSCNVVIVIIRCT